jgi:hypothetical protein
MEKVLSFHWEEIAKSLGRSHARRDTQAADLAASYLEDGFGLWIDQRRRKSAGAGDFRIP